MSFYVQIEGTITLNKKEDFEKLVDALKESKYLSEDEKEWLDEMNSFLCKAELNRDTNTIEFQGFHRNITHILDPLLDNMEFKGELLIASTDGCFEAEIVTGLGKENKNVDLGSYGRHKLGINCAEDDEDFGDLQQVIDAFFKDPHWIANSVDFIKN